MAVQRKRESVLEPLRATETGAGDAAGSVVARLAMFPGHDGGVGDARVRTAGAKPIRGVPDALFDGSG